MPRPIADQIPQLAPASISISHNADSGNVGTSVKPPQPHLHDCNDEELIQIVRSRSDKQAFALLLSRYQNVILSVVKRYSGPRFPQDDIYQEASIGLWEACFIHKDDMKSGFPGLIKRRAQYRALRYVSDNKCIVRAKDHRTVSAPDISISDPTVEMWISGLVDAGPSPERMVAAKVARRLVHATIVSSIDAMDEVQRAVFVYRTLHSQVTFRDAGVALGCAASTVMLREQKTIAWMRARLAGHFNTADILADLSLGY